MDIIIKKYTKEKLNAVIEFELNLRKEESGWNWEIDGKYIDSVSKSFEDGRFDNSLSLIAFDGEKAVGRIDCALIASRFDGSVKAYLDWICVLKSCRHKGVAQKLMEQLRIELKTLGIDTLIGLIAGNKDAQSFYRSVKGAVIKDEGIWIDI